MLASSISDLPAFYKETSMLNVVVETSKGMSVKLKYDEDAKLFRAHKALPVGFTFPFNFGFIPNTISGDGDPLDALILSSHEIPAGSIVVGKVISVLEAEQVENKKKERNDRLIVAPWDTVTEAAMLPEVTFDQTLQHAITDFFTKYNEAQGKQFRALTYGPARRGIQLTREAMQAAQNKREDSANHHQAKKGRS
jgi:inorganic pyrophosphatase